MSRFRIDLPNFLIFKMPEIRRSLNKNLTKLKHIDICVWCKRLRSWDPTEMYCPLSYSNVIVRLLTFVSAWIWSESVQWTFVWWLLYTKFVSSRCVITYSDEIAEVFDRETFLTRFILKCMIEQLTKQSKSPVVEKSQEIDGEMKDQRSNFTNGVWELGTFQNTTIFPHSHERHLPFQQVWVFLEM